MSPSTTADVCTVVNFSRTDRICLGSSGRRRGGNSQRLEWIYLRRRFLLPAEIEITAKEAGQLLSTELRRRRVLRDRLTLRRVTDVQVISVWLCRSANGSCAVGRLFGFTLRCPVTLLYMQQDAVGVDRLRPQWRHLANSTYNILWFRPICSIVSKRDVVHKTGST